MLLYWQIGRAILMRQGRQSWGAQVIERLTQDLRNAFPAMKSFCRANRLYVRTCPGGTIWCCSARFKPPIYGWPLPSELSIWAGRTDQGIADAQLAAKV